MTAFHTDQPFERPRPAFDCLPHAVEAAIRHGTILSEINLDRWAQSYPPATPEDVASAWTKALTRIAPNSGEECGK